MALELEAVALKLKGMACMYLSVINNVVAIHHMYEFIICNNVVSVTIRNHFGFRIFQSLYEAFGNTFQSLYVCTEDFIVTFSSIAAQPYLTTSRRQFRPPKMHGKIIELESIPSPGVQAIGLRQEGIQLHSTSGEAILEHGAAKLDAYGSEGALQVDNQTRTTPRAPGFEQRL